LAIDWEQTFRNWSKPSSDNEAEKQENALRMVKDAINAYKPLDAHFVRFIPQGSYHNNTNVRQESDVDICVCCTQPYFTNFQKANYGSVEGEVDSPYSYSAFKNDVEAALKAKFGKDGYSRGDKAFNVHPNAYRVHADVVAALEYREYLASEVNALTGKPVAIYTIPTGVKFFTDSGKMVVNWPEQHYSNGVAKNALTGNRFKYIVRALKRLKFYMAENGKPEMESVPSYLIECLVYCSPGYALKGDSYYENVKNVLAHAIVGTAKPETCSDWQQVHEKNPVFGAGQPWSHTSAQQFCLEAWMTVGFGE
jgi:hypothetical protein